MHRAYLKGNRWDNINRWELVLNESAVAQAIVDAAETRFYASMGTRLRTCSGSIMQPDTPEVTKTIDALALPRFHIAS